MRRKLLVLAAAAMLALTLAIPASASQSREISGTFVEYGLGDLDTKQVGNSCHVTATNVVTEYFAASDGGIEADCVGSYTVVERGICSGGPGNQKMVLNLRSFDCVGTVLGRAGEFNLKGNAVFRPPDIDTFTSWILVSGTGGDLVGLQGHLMIYNVFGEYTGEVHFDPDK